MKTGFLVLGILCSSAFARLHVSVSYNLPYTSLQKALDAYSTCEKRPDMKVACVIAPFKEESAIYLSCGSRQPTEKIGCLLHFFDKRKSQPGEFGLSLSTIMWGSHAKENIAKILKTINDAPAGAQHLNLGNPFFDQPDGNNYVCERESDKPWNCYLSVTQSRF